jgi:hypothetical protein
MDHGIHVYHKACQLYGLAVYVDDNANAGAAGRLIPEFKEALGNMFNGQDLGRAS